jgi:hypothetical protein
MRTVHITTAWILICDSFVKAELTYSSLSPLRLHSNGTQCTDDDRALWQSSSSNNRQFFSNIETCGSRAAGAVDITANVSSCMSQIYPDLSASCAQCFGSDVDCGATNCRVPCQSNQNSDECQTCLEPCSSALASCTGTTNLPVRGSGSASGASNPLVTSSIVSSLMMYGIYLSVN